MLGSLKIILLQISYWVFRWKNYENRSIFSKDMDSKDMDKSIVCGFFGPPCRWQHAVSARCQFSRQNWQNRFIQLHSLLLHSETDWNIAIRTSKVQQQLLFDIVCKFGKIRSSNSRVCECQLCVHPVIDQQWGYFSYVRWAAILPDTAAIDTQFCGSISTQFCFTTIAS